MNALIRISSLMVVSTALAVTGCSKKSEAPAAPMPATPAANTVNDATKSASELAAAAKRKADEATAAAAAKMKAEQAAAAAAKKPADEAAASTPMAAPAMTPPMAAGTGQSDLAGATSLAAGGTVDALKAQAEQLLSQYSGQLATLKTNAVALKGLIDKNAGMLPAGVSAKYQELNTMLPQLTGLVDTLKNYQTADLATLVPKLKDDFSKAQKLYTEIRGLMPQ